MAKPRNHSEVAHQWASRQLLSGSSGNMHFNGESIYSYGWYEMARFCKAPDGSEYVIATAQKYSNSTAKHLNLVIRAIPFGIPVFYSNIRSKSYWPYYNNNTDLSAEAVIKTFLENIEQSYNRFLTPKSHLLMYNTTDKQVHENHCIWNKADQFCKLTQTPWNQDLDKFKVSDFEIALLRRMVAPLLAQQHENQLKREERERLMAEAHERLQARYGVDQFEAAKHWIITGQHLSAIDLPETDPDVQFTKIKKLYIEEQTAMRIVGNEVVTNRSARVPVDDAKRLWRIIQSGRPVHGESVGLYTAQKWNGELVVGCHHIQRPVVEFFVQHYNW